MSKKVRRQAIGVALFPFLAVLICTMGALIVLLVLLVQQASLDAQEIVKERARTQQPVDPLAAERKVAQEKVEGEEWRRGILETQRSERVEELANARLKVAHLADHIRRLQEHARTLIARAQQIDRGEDSKSPDLTAEQQELARLQDEIARRKAELEAKKQELAAKDRSYALIPYDGPNGTKRRPIYIECMQRGVVLQPEGLILGPADFNGPLNPGNPLDAAIRAIREAWKQSGEPGEPYPLLVVRPDGIVAYQYARMALRGYDEEFGYELVGADKHLDYGRPNPAMQRLLEQVVGSARQRQVLLAAAMPKKFQGEDEVTSFVAEEHPSYQEAVAAAGGSGNELGGVGGTGNGGVGGIGNGTQRSGTAGGIMGSTTGSNTPGINSQFSATNNSLQASRAGQGGSGNYHGADATSGNPNASQVNGGYAGGNAAAGGNTAANGQPAGGQMGSVQGGSPRPGSSNVAGQPSGGGQGSAGQQSSGQASGGPPSPGGSQTGASASGSNTTKAKGTARSGNNWGLPGAAGKSTAVTRPIRVVCLPDRLVVVPEKGDDRAAAVIPVSPQLQPAEADAFVAAVQKHLNSWGAAMTNGYWKPVLQVEVTRASEPQFETLQMLLQGSGFEIERKPQ